MFSSNLGIGLSIRIIGVPINRVNDYSTIEQLFFNGIAVMTHCCNDLRYKAVFPVVEMLSRHR